MVLWAWHVAASCLICLVHESKTPLGALLGCLLLAKLLHVSEHGSARGTRETNFSHFQAPT